MSDVNTVFLDRDGTINEKAPDGEYVLSPDQLRLLPGVSKAIRSLNDSGIRVVVLTNQRCVAKRLISLGGLGSIHRRLEALLAEEGAHVDAVYVCPHEEGECECRKPRPGLFHIAKRDHPDIDLSRSVMIGDSLSDVAAATAVGVGCIFLGPAASAEGCECARDLPDAVTSLLRRSGMGPQDRRNSEFL